MRAPVRVGPVPGAPKKKQPFPVPWGLFVALGVYGLLVLGFVWWRYWSSPEYQAASEFAAAMHILGVDEGRKAPADKLVEAYEHLLEAGRLMPQVRDLHVRAERLNSVFEERHIGLPSELRRRAEANASVYSRLEAERAPILVIGVRDRGWAPDQLLDGPATTFAWSTIGVLVIVVIWAYGQFNARRIREREHEAELRKTEAELKALEGVRPRRPPPAP